MTFSGDIPGYYYDPDKGKYFKVEKNATAPKGAHWSRENVKRREADLAKEAKRVRKSRGLQPIKRCCLSRGTSATRCLLDAESGILSTRYRDAITPSVWAGSVVCNGHVGLWPDIQDSRRGPNVTSFCVHHDDSGLARIFGTFDEKRLMCAYVPPFGSERADIVAKSQALRMAPHAQNRMFSQISSVTYHRPTKTVFVTSREPSRSCRVDYVSTSYSNRIFNDTPGLPDSRITRTTITVPTPNISTRSNWVVNKFVPAPENSPILGTICGNLGLLSVRRDGNYTWQDGQTVGGSEGNPREIFGLDYPFANQPEVVLAGGRAGKVWRQDMRCVPSSKADFRVGRGISHLRRAGQYSIAIAGLDHQLALYDVRWPKTRPTTTFSDYKNSSSLNLGFDIDVSNNILAAANDDCTVHLYSISSGFRLPSPEVDAIRLRAPIQALMFDTLAYENNASLFVGEGLSVGKYSLGTNDVDEEG